jgi:transcription initiation factor IIE alpha subunit
MTTRKSCAILKALYHAPCTQKELVIYTGLNINTIRSNVNILVEEGFIIATLGEKRKTGPSPYLYTLNPIWKREKDNPSKTP